MIITLNGQNKYNRLINTIFGKYTKKNEMKFVMLTKQRIVIKKEAA